MVGLILTDALTKMGKRDDFSIVNLYICSYLQEIKTTLKGVVKTAAAMGAGFRRTGNSSKEDNSQLGKNIQNVIKYGEAPIPT